MSKRINIAMPTHDTMHLVLGYQEVIETQSWGLQKIGYDVSVSYNELRPDPRNIVFRADEASIPRRNTYESSYFCRWTWHQDFRRIIS